MVSAETLCCSFLVLSIKDLTNSFDLENKLYPLYALHTNKWRMFRQAKGNTDAMLGLHGQVL